MSLPEPCPGKISTYYFWKWAENDLPGPPAEVHAALLHGELHHAVQVFDARPLLDRLDLVAASGRAYGEEWEWQVVPRETPDRALFIFVTCPDLAMKDDRLERFLYDADLLGYSGCDEQTRFVTHNLKPKLNCFISGQLHERIYDITESDLPYLIRRLDSRETNAYAIIENSFGRFTQCHAHKRRFYVEWSENKYTWKHTQFDQWRVQDARRLAAIGGVNEEGMKIPESEEPDLVLYAVVLRVFQAFLRGEPRPTQYPWRNVNYLCERA